MVTLAPVNLLLLALVFAWAGGWKLRDPAAFRAVLRKLVPPVVAVSLSTAVPLAEVAMAVLLLSGWHARATAIAAAVLLVVFSAVLLRMHRLHVGGCGCFGERASGQSVARGLARNALLIVAAAWVAAQPPAEPVWHAAAPVLAGRATVVLGIMCAWGCANALFDSVAATQSMLQTVNQ
jgi:hypothetical protein